MALERGQERVLKGAKTGFKRYKKRNLAKFENLEKGKNGPCNLFPHLSSLFFHRLASFFTRFS